MPRRVRHAPFPRQMLREGVNRTGRCLMPLMKLERRRLTAPASSMSGRRRAAPRTSR